MKIETSPAEFRPVSITCETPEELQYLTWLIGGTSHELIKELGIDNSHAFHHDIDDIYNSLKSTLNTRGLLTFRRLIKIEVR